MKVILKKRKYVTYILFLLLYLGIFIDNYVGYQMRTGIGENSLSKLYRLIMLAYILMILVINDMNKNNIYLFLFVYGMILPFIQALHNETYKGLFTDILNVAKILFPIMMIAAGVALHRRRRISAEDFDVYLKVAAWIYPLSILIPYILGVGFKAYSGTSGFSGFYSSGNEISIVLCVTFIIHMETLYMRAGLKNIIGVFVSAISIILTGTKTGVIIMIVTVIYYLVKRDSDVAKKIFYGMLATFVVVIFIFVVVFFLSDEMNANIARLQYKFWQLDGNVINFMFSYRNMKILPNLYEMIESPIEILFGAGYFQKVVETQVSITSVSTGLIEMDFFDILFQYGAIMALVVWGYFINFLYKNKKCKKRQYYFAVFCMLLYAFMAGHTFYSATTGTLLACLCLSIVLSEQENRTKGNIV